jgi:amino acid permease
VPSDDLFTRDEALGGLPAGRARTLLFLIESRTAHLVARSRQAMEMFLTEQAAAERDLAFLEAFALGREPPLRPSIQDLERYAPQWADLVPANARVQAALAHLLAQKYTFTYQATPGIRAAVGLDMDAAQHAYRRLYREPLATIYASRVAPVDRLRWAVAALARRLESLPPFWTAFSLTLTETVGAGILALPIALAGVGPLAGVVLLVVLGIINQLTIAAMAEAVARNGSVRYGHAFIGLLVSEYLGPSSSLLLTVVLILEGIASLLAFYIGVSTQLQYATHVPAVAWTALLFGIGLYVVSRKSLNATVASALVVGAIAISLILLLALLGLTHLQPANLVYTEVPYLGGLQLVFGVILGTYFGHLSVSNCARVVLHRDPSARALIRGSVAAQVAAMLLYCTWVLAVQGAIAPQVLAGQAGTSLAPLAALVGTPVLVLGSILVIVAPGMGSIHLSLGLVNLVREWLPTQHHPIVLLPRRRGQLLFHEHGAADRGLRAGLAYLGLDGGQPQFRLDSHVAGHARCVDMTVRGHWDVTALGDRLPELRRHGLRLALDVLDADQERVRLRVTSSLRVSYVGEWDATGAHMGDLLELPDAMRRLVTWLMRQGEVSLPAVVAHSGQEEGVVRAMLDNLVGQGLVREIRRNGAPCYRAHLALRRGRQLPDNIWHALDEQGTAPAQGDSMSLSTGTSRLVQRARDTLSGRAGRLLSAGPVLLVFLLAEWLLLHGGGSFAGALSFSGVIAASTFGGIFPMLLLVASRRKGEFVPARVYRFLAHPALITTLYLLFLAIIFMHGLVIWQSVVMRSAAIGVGLLVLGVTVAMVRRGAFTPRIVVELRQDQWEGERSLFAITAAGQPAAAEVQLHYAGSEQTAQAAVGEVPAFSSLRHAAVHLPATRAGELKVWVHRVRPDGDAEGLPAVLDVHDGAATMRFDLEPPGGHVLLPHNGGACWLDITLAKPGGNPP